MRRAACLIAMLAGVLGCGPEEPQQPVSKCGPTTGVVAEVVDGDTIVLADGKKIRYLLVDTPEVTNGHLDCYGPEARDQNRALVLGKTVSIAYDEAGCTDRFGRLLAYVTIEGREVNSLMLERGFACVLHIPPAGSARLKEFQAVQSAARTAGRGMWGACETQPCN